MQQSWRRLRRPDGVPRVKEAEKSKRKTYGLRRKAERYGRGRRRQEPVRDIRYRFTDGTEPGIADPEVERRIRRSSLRHLHRRKRKSKESKRTALPNRRTLPCASGAVLRRSPGRFAESVRTLVAAPSFWAEIAVVRSSGRTGGRERTARQSNRRNRPAPVLLTNSQDNGPGPATDRRPDGPKRREENRETRHTTSGLGKAISSLPPAGNCGRGWRQ